MEKGVSQFTWYSVPQRHSQIISIQPDLRMQLASLQPESLPPGVMKLFLRESSSNLTSRRPDEDSHGQKLGGPVMWAAQLGKKIICLRVSRAFPSPELLRPCPLQGLWFHFLLQGV